MPNSFYTMAIYTEACIESQFSGVCDYCPCGLKGLSLLLAHFSMLEIAIFAKSRD